MSADTNFRTLGIVFLAAGVSLAISLGIAIEPVFFVTGLPMALLGVVFLGKGDPADSGKADCR